MSHNWLHTPDCKLQNELELVCDLAGVPEVGGEA
jgi:hypothetical protein